MSRPFLFATALVAACSEYDIQGEAGAPPVSALPPELENPVRVDSIKQITVPAVDVLFVVDNSCSMSDDQKLLRDNFPTFMAYFEGSGLDYHIGVVTTDMDAAKESGKLQDGGTGFDWIDPLTPDANGVFAAMTDLGSGGSGFEMGLDASFAAIEVHSVPGGANDGFYRDSARLDIVIVSDEEDQSEDLTQAEFIAYLGGLKVSETLLGFSSIVNIPPCCSLFDGGSPGDIYMAVTDEIGGIKWDIKDGDWTGVLELLGIQASGLKREFFLSELPVSGTVIVQVIDVEGTEFEFQEGADWIYSAPRNSVTFLEYLPPPLADVVITFEALAAAEAN